MTLVSFDDFRLGLFIGGPRDRVPVGGWRRYKGAAPFSQGAFETRWGSSNVQTATKAHSIFEWNGSRYVGVGDDLYKDGVATIEPFDITGVSSDPPRVHADTRAFHFFVAAPTPGQDDWLYVVGMGEGGAFESSPAGAETFQNLYKINSAGTVQRVGMAPPSGGGAAAANGTSDPPAAGDYLWDVVAYAGDTELESLPTGAFGGSPLIGYVRSGPFTVTTNGTNDYDLTLPSVNTKDSQITKMRIYCSQKDGDILFYMTDVDEDDTTLTLTQTLINGIDTTRAFDPSQGTPPGTLKELLPTGSDQLDQWSDAVMHLGRSWWGRILSNGTDFTGQSGRVYFSKQGFPEYIQDFIQLTDDDEQVQRVIVFDGRLYCFSNEALYEIVGLALDEAFGFQRVGGAPGTKDPESVAVAPNGVFYVGNDGFIWVFNGTRVEKVSLDALNPLLWGETAEDQAEFNGLYSGYARGEYFVSDGTRTFCLDERTGRLRELGLGIYAMHYEHSTGNILAALADEVVTLEEEGTLLDGTSATRIAWELQTPSVRGTAGERVFVQTVYIDADLNQHDVTVTLVEENREHTLTETLREESLGEGRKTYRLPLNRWSKDFSLRIEGDASRRVRIYGVHVELREGRSGQRQ